MVKPTHRYHTHRGASVPVVELPASEAPTPPYPFKAHPSRAYVEVTRATDCYPKGHRFEASRTFMTPITERANA